MPLEAWLTHIAELLRAVASLLWPILAIAIAILFRTDIRRVLGGLRRAKVLGNEVELLDESLIRLDQRAVAAASQILTLPTASEGEPAPESGIDAGSELAAWRAYA